MNPVQKIENTQSNSDNKQNILSINVRIDGLSFIVLNNNNLILAEAYEWQAKDWSFAATKVDEIIKAKAIPNNHFKSTFCFLQNTDTCLIPKAFYLESENKNALEIYLGKTGFDVFSVELNNAPIHLVFGVDNEISKLIKSKFPQVEFFHNSSFKIDSAINDTFELQIVEIDINKQCLEVIGLIDNKLVAHNYFQFQTVDEFMFLLLSFVKQNNFDTEILVLKVAGKLLMNSKIGVKLDKYFKKIEIKKIAETKEAAFESLKKNTLLANN